MSGTHCATCIAGGRSSDRAVIVRCLARGLGACGVPHPSVAYVGAANGDDESFFLHMKTLLKDAGAGETRLIPLAAEDADAGAAERALQSADAVFLSGGEVEDGMKWLALHGTNRVLRGLFDRGTAFLGLSAGSIMMGTHWVHWDREGDDSTASLFDCLGFIPTVFDTHAEDEDWRELKTALRLLGPGARGFGIPSGGAVLADSGGGLVDLAGAVLPFRNDGGTVKRD